MNMPLTPFQMDCERAAAAELKRHGSDLVRRQIEGGKESFVRAVIQGTDAELFIYEDEAGIQGPSIDIRFESPDYRSPMELIADVVGRLRSLVGGTDI